MFNYIWFHQYAFNSSKPGTSVFFRILEIFQDDSGGVDGGGGDIYSGCDGLWWICAPVYMHMLMMAIFLDEMHINYRAWE